MLAPTSASATCMPPTRFSEWEEVDPSVARARERQNFGIDSPQIAWPWLALHTAFGEAFRRAVAFDTSQ